MISIFAKLITKSNKYEKIRLYPLLLGFWNFRQFLRQRPSHDEGRPIQIL